MAYWVWSEQVRDTRLPGRWAARLDGPHGWRLRRWLSPWQPLLWHLCRKPVGYAPGPALALRRRRHGRSDRPVRVCLLEGPQAGPRFSPVTAFWINERSRLVHAVVDDVSGADVVWVHTQDPIAEQVREWLDGVLGRVRVPVLNEPDRYDAYHRHDTFATLHAAGVCVPDPAPEPGQLVVLKGPGQTSSKLLTRLDDVPEGWRAFAYVDATGKDGLHRRYRAFHLLGVVHPGDVVSSRSWQVGLGTLEGHEPTYAITEQEVDQVRRIADVLGLDWFCVDFIRRAADGRAVFTDINVYPTPVVSEAVDQALGARGRWHFLDTAERMGVPEPHGSFWPRFDAVFETFAGASRG